MNKQGENEMNIEEIKREVKIIIASMQNCLDDDFEQYFKTDIKNWINDLIGLNDKLVK